MITRLRPAYLTSKLAEIYAVPHRHVDFIDHLYRVNATVAAGCGIRAKSAADLSCGDGAILRALDADLKIFGDFAPGYDIQGPIEMTIHYIPNVDLFVCCETLEHVDDPLAVLVQIRAKAGRLLLSTPVGAFEDSNPEHYWAWDRESVEEILGMAGWTVDSYTTSDHRAAGYTYAFGIWTCS